MKTFLVVFTILLYPIFSHASDDKYKWTATDTALQVVFLTTLDIDRAQTVEASKHPKSYEEVGRAKHFIGRHPSVHQVNNYFIASAILHTGIAYVLPNPYRKIWQGTWIIIETNTINHNVSVGIGVRF
jgi:hypothetical protein